MSELIFCFSSDKKENDYILPHMHSCWELVCYWKGGGETRIGETSYAFTDGTFALIPPCCKHDERHTQDGNLCCIGFEADLPSNIGSVFSEDDPTLRNTVERILREARAHLAKSEEMLSLLIQELILLLHRREGEKRLPLQEFALARRFLEENSHTDLKLSTLAKSYGWSYDYFRHRFKEAYGVSPQSYLIVCRLENARKMLGSTDKNCTEIAYLCGFSDSAQFSTMFRRAYGVSPKKYATQIKNTSKK